MAIRFISITSLLISIAFSDHELCIMDTASYHESTIITNLCIDLIAEFNFSFRIDCDANSVTYSEYIDTECKKERRYGLPDGEDLFRIDEGCDDPWDINAYVQVKECDDANYIGGGSGGKAASYNYTDCEWFGSNDTNAPIYPINVCTAHSHVDELDNLWLYSTKLECNSIDQVMEQYEYNNTDCAGAPYNTIQFKKEDGYFFNCGTSKNPLPSCPWTKIKLTELRNSTSDNGGSSDNGGDSGGGGSTSNNNNDNKRNNLTAIIFTVIIGIVIIILVIMIGFTIIARKNRASQVLAANIAQEPLTVDFQSIGDAQDDKVSPVARGGKVIFSEEPDNIQQITTQGQDIQEISFASSEADMR